MRHPLFRLLMTTDSVGGVWQYSVDLARALVDLNIETVLAVLGPSPSRAQTEKVLAIEGVRLLDTGLSLDWLAEDAAAIIKAGKAVAELADAADADIVQLNSAALAAGAIYAVPVVAVQHSCVASWWEAVNGDALPADFTWRTSLVRAGLEAADAVVTPTGAFGEITRRIYDLEDTPFAVHNGRRPLPLSSGAPHDCAFTAGRLWDRGKNLATIDAAAAGLNVPVHAAGPMRGPNGSMVMFDNIHSLGQLDEAELGRWLAARPVFVSAALYEPFGLAVLEAAMAGCPLVLSDIPTFRELWDDAAIFVSPRDESGFARAIGDLVGDEFLRTSLGATARERAARYTPEAMAAQMANIYRRLLPAVEGPVLAAKVAA